MKKIIFLVFFLLWATSALSYLNFYINHSQLNDYADEVRAGKVSVTSEQQRDFDRWIGTYKVNYTMLLPDKTVRMQEGLAWLSASKFFSGISFCAQGLANTPANTVPKTEPENIYGEVSYNHLFGNWWSYTICAK